MIWPSRKTLGIDRQSYNAPEATLASQQLRKSSSDTNIPHKHICSDGQSPHAGDVDTSSEVPRCFSPESPQPVFRARSLSTPALHSVQRQKLAEKRAREILGEKQRLCEKSWCARLKLGRERIENDRRQHLPGAPARKPLYEWPDKSERTRISSNYSDTFLLPRDTPHLLCNWSPLSSSKSSALVDVLHELWDGLRKDMQHKFYDLGCGDGRVVMEVCKAFPTCLGKGIDLNPVVVESARATAKLRGIERCDFLVGDVTNVDLKDASAIFFYLPVAALATLVRKTLPKAGIQQGVVLITADGPFPSSASGFMRKYRNYSWYEREGLHCYLWQANCE